MSSLSHQLWAPWRRRRRHPRFLWSLLVSPILLAADWQTVLRGQSEISPGSRAPPAIGLVGKTVQALTELDPAAKRMAILWNPNAAIEERRAQAIAAAGAFGITPLVIEVRDLDGIVAAFAAMREQRANALFVVTDPLTLQNRNAIVGLAAANRIPAVYEFGEFVRAGGLVAYAPSITAQFRRAAIYVDKILHGAKPGDYHRTAYQVRPGHQSQDRQGARNHDSADGAATRGRGDSVAEYLELVAVECPVLVGATAGQG